MSRLIHSMTVFIIAILLVGALFTSPVAADADNIFCEGDEETDLGGYAETISTLIVTFAAAVAIIGGGAYTLASAARPGEEEYVESRNKAVKRGAFVIIVIYVANAAMTELVPELEFSCILPFAGSD